METKEKITLRMLIGTPLTAEWRMLTHGSSVWKEMQIAPMDQRDLFIASHQGNEYIACFINPQSLSLKEAQNAAEDLWKKLEAISPKHDPCKDPVCIFTQIFLA